MSLHGSSVVVSKGSVLDVLPGLENILCAYSCLIPYGIERIMHLIERSTSDRESLKRLSDPSAWRRASRTAVVPRYSPPPVRPELESLNIMTDRIIRIDERAESSGNDAPDVFHPPASTS